MKAHKLKPLVLAVGFAVQALAQQSFAQEEVAPVEEVLVTGFRSSVLKALDAKREAIGTVDSIMAEDIADFPDQNLAESLQRIPGIAINRDAGEGRQITVRGLNSSFTKVQLNGMQAQSLSAGSTGIRTDRGFDFNVFASELFNKLSVHKTTSAKLDEGSLGATVELNTGRPFDYNEDVMAVNLQGSYNDLSEKTSPRASGMMSMQNDEGTLGALMSVSYSERFVNNNGPQTGRWQANKSLVCADCDADVNTAIQSAQHPRFPRVADRTHDQSRTGITTTFQWLPSESTNVALDILHSEIKEKRLEPFMQAISFSKADSDKNANVQSNVVNPKFDASGNLIAASIQNVDVRSEYFEANWETKFDQYSINVEHEFNDNLKMNVLLGTSQSELNNREFTVAYEHFSVNDTRRNIDYAESQSTMTYDFSDMLNPTISYDWDQKNPANWEKSEYRDRIHSGTSGSDTFRVDLEYTLNDVFSFEGGFTKLKYDYSQTASRADALFSSLQDATTKAACGVTPEVTAGDGSVQSHGGFDYFMAGPGQTLEYTLSNCWPYKVTQGDLRSVVEDDLSFYGQVNFDVEMGSMRLRGDAGVRRATTEVESSGIIGGEIATVSNDYSDTLPSLNLALNVTDDIVLRASAAKVMARPNLGDLTPGGSIAIFGDPKVSYGNPLLDPFRAKAYDLGAEWYFGEGGMVSLAYFQKDIESFPTFSTDVIKWAETGLPNELLGSQVETLKNADFEVKRKTNGDGGTLDGFEVQVQQGLNIFADAPQWVQNFGVIANVTFVNSEVKYGTKPDVTNTDGSVVKGEVVYGPLTEQSDTSANFTVYWENEKISTRISAANRGEYYDTFDSLGRPENHRIYEATTYVDASFSYTLTDNLKLSLEGINLTNEIAVFSINENDRLLIDTSETGRQITFGVSYKL